MLHKLRSSPKRAILCLFISCTPNHVGYMELCNFYRSAFVSVDNCFYSCDVTLITDSHNGERSYRQVPRTKNI